MSTLTLTIQESATWRLYTGREVMDTERLWWDARVGFERTLPHEAAGMLWSIWQSEEAKEGVGDSEDDSAEEDEKEEEDGEGWKASDTLLQELWNDWREGEQVKDH